MESIRFSRVKQSEHGDNARLFIDYDPAVQVASSKPLHGIAELFSLSPGKCGPFRGE